MPKAPVKKTTDPIDDLAKRVAKMPDGATKKAMLKDLELKKSKSVTK